MGVLSKKGLWMISSGSMVAGASLFLFKESVRQKASKTGDLVIKKGSEWSSALSEVPGTVMNAWETNSKKYLMLVHTLSEEVKKLQFDTSATGEHVHKAYLNGMKSVNDIKDIKLKTQAILTGEQKSIIQNGEQHVKLEEATNNMTVQSLS